MSALDDLISSDMGKPASGGSALDSIISRDMGAQAQPAQAAAQPAQSATPQNDSLFGNLTRQIGLTGRAAVNGLAGIPLMAGDALNSALNLIPGVHLQMPSQAANQLMDKAGIPQPQNATERVVQDVAGGMAGAGGFIKAGSALVNAASPIIKGIGATMQQLPGMQALGAAGAGAGGGIARENDAGALGQIGGGVLGGLLGAVLPSAGIAGVRSIKAIPANISGSIAPVINPKGYVGSQLANFLGDDASSIAANIRNAPEYVPGSLPTTAQAGTGAKLVATEKAALNSSPDLKTAFANRAADNNNARWQALNAVALTEEDLQSAVDARSAITTPMYNEAHTNTANVGASFMKYAQIPEMQEAMQRADSIASLDAAVGSGVPPVWPTPDSKAINGSALDYTSRALGDMIGEASRAGSNTKARSLSLLKNNVDDWMGRYIPGVGEARSDFATLSSPINTMEAGQQMQGALGTRGMDVNSVPLITLPGYRTSLTKAIKDQKFGIDPEAHQQLQGIGQDLQRASISNALTTPGSDSVYNIGANGWLAKQLYGPQFSGGSPLAKGVGSLAALVTGHPMVSLGLLGGGNKLGTMVGGGLQKQLGNMLLNPNDLLPYLDAVGKQSPKALPSSLGRNINQGLLGAFSTERTSP